MYPHLYGADPYYVRALEYELYGARHSHTPPAEIEIPLRWIMVWLGVVTVPAFALASLINWIA